MVEFDTYNSKKKCSYIHNMHKRINTLKTMFCNSVYIYSYIQVDEWHMQHRFKSILVGRCIFHDYHSARMSQNAITKYASPYKNRLEMMLHMPFLNLYIWVDVHGIAKHNIQCIDPFLHIVYIPTLLLIVICINSTILVNLKMNSFRAYLLYCTLYLHNIKL